jgi:hypothetical protein
MAFWGNPITSGSDQIDYFISADVLEHPYRTRMPVTQEPYSEQVRGSVMGLVEVVVWVVGCRVCAVCVRNGHTCMVGPF